jgi:membrane-anchored protein YejM (alkaline phosphatase superfamily)
MKNIVLIHLESLNDAFYLLDNKLFPNLKKLEEKSAFFSNYWSTATSTIMSACDLMYGNGECSEMSVNLEKFNINENYKSWIHSPEYKFKNINVIIYPKFDWVYDKINFRKIFGNDSEIYYENKYEKFCNNISEKLKQMDGDFLYVYDWESVNMKNQSEIRNDSWKQYHIEQFKHIDNTVGFIIDEINRLNKAKDTLIIAFGDHGDEVYTYGKNNGFTHAIPPYPDIIRTPVFIFKYGMTQQNVSQLVCNYDISRIVDALWSEKKVCIDRDYIFSRNLFPLQNSESLNKGYSVVDGDYLLLITSKGYELYNCCFLSMEKFNLLNWYKLKKDGRLQIKKIERMHFERLIYDQTEEIEEAFYKLRKILYYEIVILVDKNLLNKEIKKWFYKINYNVKN